MKTKIFAINILRFFLLVILQTFIFNKINLGGYLNPMVYVLFILLLPFEISGFLLLVLAFIMGLSIDIFVGSIGLHTGATVFMAFLRPISLKFISSNREYETGITPGINDLGYLWFVKYTVFLVFSHHLFFFFMEAFSFSEFAATINRILLSTGLSVAIIIFLNIMFKPNVKRK
jgi:hypothetical protein